MIEKDREVFFEFDLSEFNREDIDVDVKDDFISINADKKVEIKEDNESNHSYEKTERSFSYSSSLPNVKSSDTKVVFEDGKLKITIPKK